MPRSRIIAALLVALSGALVAGACSTTASEVSVGGTTPLTSATTAPTTAPPPAAPTTITPGPGAAPATAAPTLTWTACGGLQCAHLPVPLDYSDPSKGTIELFLKRHVATTGGDRVGSLLVNPGGPGVAGTTLVDQATLAFSENLLDHFDIVGWDPRGTGQSSPVNCVDDLDPLLALDPAPTTPGEKQALIDSAKAFDAACEQQSGKLLPYVSTQDSARDMDQIRQALGEDKISYFGFSYGSELGATYATMFPSHVRAMTIDGAADPNAGYVESTKEQVVGMERGLQAMLADCAQNPKCAFYHNGNPQAAYDALMAKLETDPLPSPEASRPPIGPGIAMYAVLSGLYLRDFWPLVTRALAAAERGDGSGLLDLYDSYVERDSDGTWSNTWEDLIAINCLDDPGPLDPTFPDTFVSQLQALSPHFGAFVAYDYTCIYWPTPQKPPIKITGAGAGPIVVVGTTGDPITPIESTKAMAAALQDGILVTVQADQHTGYGVNRCVVNAVDQYLINLTQPPAGLVCS